MTTSSIPKEEKKLGGRMPTLSIFANAMAHQIERYRKYGVDFDVAKPTRRAEIGAALCRVLNPE